MERKMKMGLFLDWSPLDLEAVTEIRSGRPASILWALVFCGMRNAESCQGVICRKSSVKRSANYPLSLFRIPQLKNSAFPRIAKILVSTNRHLGKNNPVFFWSICQRIGQFFLQFLLTSKSVPHSKCHIILLVNVNGFNLYNRCDSCRDNHMN